MVRRGGALLIGLSALAGAGRAAAFPSTRLVYARGPGAEQCPDQAAVRQAVAARLGYDPFFPSSDKTIIARVLREPDRLKGQVELVDEHGSQVGMREFSAAPEKCDDLIRAMALSMSIAIDPKSAETYSQGPAETAEKQPKSPPRPPAAPPPPSVPDPARSALRPSPAEPSRALVEPSLGIAALGSLGTAPNPTLGAALFGALRWQAWSLALEARVDLPTTGEERGVPLRTSTWAANAVPCFHFGVGFGCAVGSLRWLRATRTDGDANVGTRAFWALGGRLGAELPLAARFGVLGYVDLMAVPAAPQVQAGAEASPAWKPSAFSGDLAIAAVIHF